MLLKISGIIKITKKHDVSKIEAKLKELGYVSRLEIREDQMFYEILVKNIYVFFWLAAISLPIFLISFFLFTKNIIGWVFFYYLVFLSATIIPVTYDGLRNKLHKKILQNLFQKKSLPTSIFQFSKASYLGIFGVWVVYFVFLFFYTADNIFLLYTGIHFAIFIKLLFGFIETKTSYENTKTKIFYIIASVFALLMFYISVIVARSIGMFIAFTPGFVFLIWGWIFWEPFSYKKLLTVRRAIIILTIIIGFVLVGLFIVENYDLPRAVLNNYSEI